VFVFAYQYQPVTASLCLEAIGRRQGFGRRGDRRLCVHEFIPVSRLLAFARTTTAWTDALVGRHGAV